VLSIIKSNQSYCIDLGGSYQGWIKSEYTWVVMMLTIPKFNKLPKAHQEQVKRSYRHIKDTCKVQQMIDRLTELKQNCNVKLIINLRLTIHFILIFHYLI